jgi:hypothetical protein
LFTSGDALCMCESDAVLCLLPASVFTQGN